MIWIGLVIFILWILTSKDREQRRQRLGSGCAWVVYLIFGIGIIIAIVGTVGSFSASNDEGRSSSLAVVGITPTAIVSAPQQPTVMPITKTLSTETLNLQYPSTWEMDSQDSDYLSLVNENAVIQIFWSAPDMDTRTILLEKIANSNDYQAIQKTLEVNYQKLLSNYGKVDEFHITDRKEIGHTSLITGAYQAVLKNEQGESAQTLLADFICGYKVVCTIIYASLDAESIAFEEWQTIGTFADNVQIHPQVEWTELDNGRITIQYPAFWEAEEQRSNVMGFSSGASELFVFHYYTFDYTIEDIVEIKESKPLTWRSLRQKMENYSRDWTLSQKWEVVDENPIVIQTLGHQTAICEEKVSQAELSKTRLMRSLTCEFDCSDYICGINYVHFGDEAFTSGEWNTISQFADFVKVE